MQLMDGYICNAGLPQVVGVLKMRTFLSGMPECKLGLNDKVLFESQGRSGKQKVGTCLCNLHTHINTHTHTHHIDPHVRSYTSAVCARLPRLEQRIWPCE